MRRVLWPRPASEGDSAICGAVDNRSTKQLASLLPLLAPVLLVSSFNFRFRDLRVPGVGECRAGRQR